MADANAPPPYGLLSIDLEVFSIMDGKMTIHYKSWIKQELKLKNDHKTSWDFHMLRFHSFNAHAVICLKRMRAVSLLAICLILIQSGHADAQTRIDPDYQYNRHHPAAANPVVKAKPLQKGTGLYFNFYANMSSASLNDISIQGDRYNALSLTETEGSDGIQFAPSIGLGYNLHRIGMPVRMDLEYTVRSKMEFDQPSLFSNLNNVNHASTIESQMLLLNTYWDFPRVGKMIQPYVGFGVGVGWSESWSETTASDGFRLSDSVTNTNFAYSLMTGASIALGQNWFLDARYRYVNAGQTDILTAVTQAEIPTLKAESLTAHEFGVGLRFHF